MGLVGQQGIAATDLHPAGKIELADERYDAYTAGEFIARGKQIIIRKASGTSLLVEELLND